MSRALQLALRTQDSAHADYLIAKQGVEDARRNLSIQCACGKRHKIGQLKLIVTHWYTSPSGCSDGDYWNEGEWQFICPTSGHRERLMFDDYSVPYEYRREMKYSAEKTFKNRFYGLFGSRVDTHGDAEERAIDPRTALNYFVDKNRKYFGIEVETAPKR